MNDKKLILKIAVAYYIDNLTQQEIGNRYNTAEKLIIE